MQLISLPAARKLLILSAILTMTKESVTKFSSYLLPTLLLTGIVFACFNRSLGSYFVADDFAQVAYASGICKGNWQALLSNFTGNYMQIPVMKIYRPCLLLSFVFDFAFWQAKACGYFFTNIFSLIAVSAMLYYLLRELTSSWNTGRSIYFSILSAALFAANPLHCESISFISGRDNVISAFFYLLTLWCFVRKGRTKNKTFLLAGTIFFWPALLSKETAIGLPLVLTAIVFFLPHLFTSSEYLDSIKNRFILAIIESLTIWIDTVVYFIVRFLALGTFTGGYTGDIGANLTASSLARWESIDTIVRLVYPLNPAIFGVLNSYYTAALSILYAALSTLVLVRFLSGKYLLNWLGLMFLWILTTIAPIYQLWGLGENLEGARFFFFLTMPLSVLLPLLIFTPLAKNAESIEEKKINLLGIATVIILIVLDINITYNNNIAWVHAGKQSRACLVESQKLANSIGADKKVALIGLPKEQDGAHVIYNGATFNTMMNAPFSSKNYNDKFVTFDPLFYGDPWLINPSRLRTVLEDPHLEGLFAWNINTLRFDSLKPPARDVLNRTRSSPAIKLQHIDKTVASVTSNLGILYHVIHHICLEDQGLFMAKSNFDPYQYDFLDLTLKTTFPKEMMYVFWRGDAGLPYCEPQHPMQRFISQAMTPTKMRVRLSNHWHWYTQGNIDRLQLEFMPGQSVQVTDMKLVCDKDLMPVISVTDAKSNNIGVYLVNKEGISLQYDGSAVENCTAVKIEISKPNYFFEESDAAENKDSIMNAIIEPTNKGKMRVTNSLFLTPAHYQLRAVCLDKAGKFIGEKSDPITIEISN
jgi:hypothetical protein